MSRDEIFLKLVPILSKQLNIEAEKISGSSNLKDDLGGDSLDMAEIEMMIEDTFGCKIDDEVQGIKTVDDVVNVLLAQVIAKEK